MTEAQGKAMKHALAVAAGVFVFALAFMYTGASDLLYALGSGLGAAVFFYITAHLMTRPRP